jgi:hypothetical protein
MDSLHLRSRSKFANPRCMAKISKPLAQIQQELRKLENEVAALREDIAAKETRLSELVIAERVLGTIGEARESPDQGVAPLKKPGWSQEKRGPKPEGTPTVTEMIIAVLRANQKSRGLEPKEIADAIANRWWPDVTINAVGPIAWRMYKLGRLVKRSSRYSLPKSDEGSDAPTSEPSSSHGGPEGTTEKPSTASSVSKPSVFTDNRRKLLAQTALPSGHVPH